MQTEAITHLGARMMRKNYTTITFLFSMAAIAAMALQTGCARSHSDAKRRIAFTSILPQKDFVQRIAGDRFEIFALVGPGQSPHSYTPTPDQMARLSEAAVFFRIGVEFEESLVKKITKAMPGIRVVDLRKGVILREMLEEHHHDGEEDGYGDGEHDEHADHDAGRQHDGGEHHHAQTHAGKDPHIWLSPRIVKQMGATIRDALIAADPQGAETYEQNLVLFHRGLDSLDAYLRRTLSPLKGTPLFVFHPAFGYFADEYGLVQIAVETGGKEPSARALARLIEQARKHKPKVIFVQPQYARKSAEALAKQIGCAVVSINPLPENYFDEMREMCRAVQSGLGIDE